MELRQDIGNNIKNIIFDLGGVIIDIYPERTVEAFGMLCKKKIAVENIFPEQDSTFLDYELGKISTCEFVQEIKKNYHCENINDHDIADAWCALIGDPQPERFKLLDLIHKNYRTFVLSNTNDLHIKRVHDVISTQLPGRSFESYFERCFYSQEMHLNKPNKEIYIEVIGQTGIIAEETLFIDDRASNFSGAVMSGLNTYHLTAGERMTDLFR